MVTGSIGASSEVLQHFAEALAWARGPCVTLSDAQTRWLEATFRQYKDKVFRTCLRFGGGDRAWALDRTQDVFVKLAEHVERVRDAQAVGTWIYRVTTTTCLEKLRRQSIWRRIAPKARQEHSPPSQHDRASTRQLAARFADALAGLTVKQRALIVLVYVEGRSQTEAAEILGISKSEASKRHRRALEALRADPRISGLPSTP